MSAARLRELTHKPVTFDCSPNFCGRASIFAQRALHSVGLEVLQRPFPLMTIHAGRVSEQSPVLLTRTGMHRVTVQTSRLPAVQNHIAHVSEYVTVASVESFIISPRPVDLIVLKQVVAGHEVVCVRQPRRFRFPAAQMALRADRCDNPRVVLPLLRQQYQLRVAGVLKIDVSVTGVAVETEGRKLSGLRIDCRRMTPGAAVGEPGLVPRGIFRRDPLDRPADGSNFDLRREQSEFSIALFPEKPRAMTTAQEVFHLRSY